MEPHTEPVVPQASCQVTALLLVPVTLATDLTVWNVSILETSVVMVTVIGAEPPPPPQDDIVAAATTARVLNDTHA